MLRRKIALVLTALLLVSAMPAALATQSYSAHTPLSGADDDKLANLRLAAQAIDGKTVFAGENFSFNETVGPCNKQRGFCKAPNGRGAMVTGGGVAQAASTLYMALLQMDDKVDIDPVKTYGKRFSDDYVQNPSLAIVTDYDAGIDLSFTNRGDDLSIDMWLDDDDLWCVVTTGRQGSLYTMQEKTTETSLSFLDGDDWPDGEDADDYLSPPHEGLGFESVGESHVIEKKKDDSSPQYYIISRPSIDDGNPDFHSVGSVYIDCGRDKDVLHNVTLAAESLNDTMLDSGDAFSFNDVVGPRTKKYGYRRAVNGRGAKVTGGGVAQVASALWLAVKDRDDIVILEKHTYGNRYNQRYVPDAADALLTDYASEKDFRFRYTGDESLTIYTYVEDGRLYCDVLED